MPDYAHKGFFELEPDEEFVITNYRLIKRKMKGEEEQQRQSPERSAKPAPEIRLSSAQRAELIGSDDQQNLNNTIADPITPAIETVPASVGQQRSWTSKVEVSNSIINARLNDDAIKAEKASRLNWDRVASLPIQDVNQRNFIRTLDGPPGEEIMSNEMAASRD
jgi:hypothetical protein